MPILSNFPGGGAKLNGITEQYRVASGENIRAGDFVRLIMESGTDTVLSDGRTSGSYFGAAALDDSRIFIAYQKSGTAGVFGAIATVSGDTITVGTETRLTTSGVSGSSLYVMSVTALDNSHVLITCITRNATYNYLHGIVVAVTGTTLTAGTPTQLTNITSDSSVGVAALNGSTVVIAYSHSITSYPSNITRTTLSGMTIIVSDTTITIGSNTDLYSDSSSRSYIRAASLGENNVLITYGNTSTDECLRGVVATVSGVTITAGTETQLSAKSDTGRHSRVLTLGENRALVVYSCGNGPLYGMVVEATGTVITAGAETQLSVANKGGYGLGVAMTGGNRVFVTHAISVNYNGYHGLYGVALALHGTTIAVGTDTFLLDTGCSYMNAECVALENERVFIAHSIGDMYLNALCVRPNLASVATPSDVAGVAKRAGSSGGTIDILRPTME